ncbi:MAG TPA: hypothetical protein VHV29_12300 [Terriglobales bacterium]|jgi:hypothetical protein|nr:hypothetical protein [Terriglobales bacterium]
MKPNGRRFAVRVAILALFTLNLLSTLATAETMRGNFKLKAETHWGKLLLAPGTYNFTMDNDTSGTLVTIRSTASQWSGMAIAQSISDTGYGQGMKLVLENSSDGVYVKALCLGENGITLNYAIPKPGKFARLKQTQPATSTIASFSRAQ